MLTPFVSRRRPGRYSWWLGLALAWAAWPAAAEPATPSPQLRPAGELPPARFAESEEPLAPAAGKSGSRVIPIDFETSTVDRETIKAVSQALWGRLDAMADLALYSSGATRRWLIRHDLFPFTPYLPPPPPERITGALKADYLITGHLNRTGGVFVLDLSVYSDAAHKYVLKDLKLEKETEADLLDAFGALSAQLHQVMTGGEAAPAGQQGTPKAAEASASSAAAKNAKAKTTVATKKTPTKVRITAKPRAMAQRTASRKTTKGTPSAIIRRAESGHAAATTPAAKAAKLESDEGQAVPAAQPTPRATPTPAPHATPKPAATVKATPSPAPPAKITEKPAPASTEASAAEPGEEALAHEPAAKTVPAVDPTPAPKVPATEATPGSEPSADPERARELFQQARRRDTPAEERLSLLAQAARLDPTNAEIQQQLALEHYDQGDYEACKAQCEQASARLSKTAMLWVIKGSALYELGRYDEAIQANETALKLDPKNVYGHFNLALVLTHQTPDKAIPVWRNFIAMFGDDPQHTALVEQARASLSGLEAAAKK